MAYASLVSLAQTIEKMIQNHDQYSISFRDKQKFISLHDCISVLQTFLEDFPEKANRLEVRIRDAANEAEDIIEYFMWKLIQSRFRSNMWGAMPVNFAARFQLTLQLSKVRREIDTIMGEVMEMKNASMTSKEMVQLTDASSSSKQVAPIDKINDVVGLDDDLIAIKSRLCGESPKLQVIPIVGMGGIGKTTLARNAFDDALTREHFDIRAWISVSQDYNTRDMLSSLLLSMEKFIIDRSKQSNDEEKVYKSLKRRRYLIVMDDMWSKKAWDDISYLFPDDNNGSRIMLTTRLLDVATYADPCSRVHEIHLMDPDLSWDLLRKKVFVDQDYPSELKDIGKEIARNCRGLPLAIVVIAGLLSAVSKTPASWREIAKNVNKAIASKEDHFEKILSLSYAHLPHRLRSCFLYMGGFPEDHEVHVSKLIKLWIAEGFLKLTNGSKSLEEEAEECLEDLVKRNLVLINKRKSHGKIKSCSLHDLMRDMCIRKAHEEKFLASLGVRPRKLKFSIYYLHRFNTYSFYHLPLPYFQNLHTIICHSCTSLPSLKSFRLLRVLDAGEVYLEVLPAQLFELFHLRFLAIKFDDMIPAAISNLQNLETLILQSSYQQWNYLPQEIWKMSRLRHLRFHGFLPDPEGTSSTLENLQTLSLVSHYSCALGILKMTPNLKKLGVNCSHYQDGTYLNNLVHLHQLESLELSSGLDDVVLRKDNFTFPSTLKKLTLRGLSIPWKDMTVIGSLPNLRVLKLKRRACKGHIWATNEEEFPQLEFLLIEDSSLVSWITESGHFPRLKSLLLHHCQYLREIPEGIGEIPTLELIEVKGRGNVSLVRSAKWIQEEQESWGNDALHVRWI